RVIRWSLMGMTSLPRSTLPRSFSQNDDSVDGTHRASVTGSSGYLSAVASCEPDEALGRPRREAYSLYVERRGRPSNEAWRRKLPQLGPAFAVRAEILPPEEHASARLTLCLESRFGRTRASARAPDVRPAGGLARGDGVATGERQQGNRHREHA